MKNKKTELLLPYIILFLHSILLIFLLIVDCKSIIVSCTNLIAFLPFIAFMILIPISWYAVYIIDAMVLFIIYYINSFLMTVRGRPINYIDFFCINDGLRVSSEYSFVFNEKIARNLAFTVFFTCIACYLFHKLKKEKFSRKRKSLSGVFSFIISVLLIFGYSEAFISKADNLILDENEFVSSNGLFVSVINEYMHSKPQKPEGYSRKKAQEILESYQSVEVSDNKNAPDTIYVIMNESLTDYSLIGEEDFKADPLEKIHSLNDNCFKGKCAVNVMGGGTCNTEFEFLTGYSLMFIPNTIPYIQFTMKNQPSIVKDMGALDYYCTAVHPFYEQEWKRKTVYEQLGFSEFVSGERFSNKYVKDQSKDIFELRDFVSFGDDLEYIRNYISDNECYKKILEKTSNQKDFIFSVTMQNHGGYLFDFSDDNMIKYLDSKMIKEEQYLNLIRISDDAFDNFINELRNSDKKTVVLMFGDHQPALDFDKCIKKNSESGNKYQKAADDYIVPYILWANYDMEWDAPDFLSINYLSAVLKKNCNIPLTPFDRFRLEAMQEYPVITSHFSVDKKGEFYSPQEAMQAQINKEYAIVQYNKLFDSKQSGK